MVKIIFFSATVPYLEIFYSLLMVLIPATIGIVLRKNSDRWADRAEKIGAMGGLMLIGASIVAGLVSCFFKSLFFWITMNIYM